MKKFFVVLFVLALITAPVFAESTASSGQAKIDSALKNIVTLCTGVIPGAIISIKFIFDIVNAMLHREQDPTKLQKAIINLIITVGIVVLYVVLIQFIFGNTPDGGNQSTQTSFMSGLIGENIEASALADYGYELENFDFDLNL